MSDQKKISNNNTDTPVTSWRQWFDRCAGHYDDPRMKMAYYEDGATGKPVSQETMDAIYRDIWHKLDATPLMTVLDVGGGVGLFARKYANHVKRIVATDISSAMIRDAGIMPPHVDLLICDGASLPFSAAFFDRTLCYSVFHYLSDLSHARKVLDEFVRVTKPSGLILIGDILKPDETQQSPSSFADKKTSSVWWPRDLSHRLSKLKINPSFFTEYCREKKIQGSILSQDIPGKNTASNRYDVTIKLR